MLGSMISATVMSPWLGGWRQVLLFYGVLSMLLSIPWYFARPAPRQAITTTETPPLRQTIAYVARIKKIWLMGWAILGIGGAIQGALGYLPLYLEDSGWSEGRASAAAASFHLMSMIFVIPIALWSDRLGSRKKVALRCALMVVAGFGLLSFVKGIAVWPAVGLAGMVRDGFMAVFLTMILETEGIGPKFAGTASGLVMVFSGIGSLIAPPLGNSLESLSPSLPFLFWSALSLAGVAGLYAAQEGSTISVPTVQPAEPG
jgi:cyanate permease